MLRQWLAFRVDVQPREDIQPGDFLTIRIADVTDNEFGTGDDSSRRNQVTNSKLVNGEWYSLDVAFSELAKFLTYWSNLAQVFVSDATISNIYVDNIYFYDEAVQIYQVTAAGPIPNPKAQLMWFPVFSDAYTNINSNLNQIGDRQL